MDQAQPPSVTIGPSPLKVLGEVALASVAGTAGLAILIPFLGFIGNPWLLANARFLLACTVATLACYGGIAAFGAMIWRRPRIEIGPDGFVTQGIVGRRARRWVDVEGDFSVVRIYLCPVVAYRLTDAAKASAGTPPTAVRSGHDEFISFSAELTIGSRELARVLNQGKQGPPDATSSASSA